MTVISFDQQRMTENNNVHDDSSATKQNTTTESRSSNVTPSMNIYSAKNVIKTTGNGTFTSGGGIPRVIARDAKAPFLSIGSKNKESVDLLNSKEHKIDELQSCHSVNEIKFGNDINDKTVLIFDLTTNGFLLSPAAAEQSSKPDDNYGYDDDDSEENCLCSNGGDVYRIHLSLPSTLVKRPKFDFEKLLQTVIDDSKRLKLISLIENCSTFLFYDGSSKVTNCCLSTFYLIRKFRDFLHGKLGKNQIRLFILEKMDKSVVKNLENENKTEMKSIPSKNSSPVYPPKKLNLSIKILPKTTDKMFIQSIKKDTVHYSPNSLKKFFKFHIPNEIRSNDEILPNWLRPFSDKNGADAILQKLLANFEYLENLELKRLEKGLITETRNKPHYSDNFSGGNTSKSDKNLQDSSSYHKIYSLSNLQREFRKQKKLASTRQSNASQPSTNAASPIDPISNLKLCIPPPSSIGTTTGNDINNNSNSNKFDSNHLSPHVDTDSSDSLLTPMDNYEMSQGIQAFTKNRYSNILPYEHSRVKLQPSPISGKTGGGSNAHAYTNNNNGDDVVKINNNKTNNATNNVQHPLSYLKSNNNHNTTTFPSITVKAPGQETDEKISINNRKRRGSSLSYFNQNQDASASSSSSSYSNVKDKEIDGETRGNLNDYFNANYLRISQVNADFNYIATQAPLPSTVDDFWKVVSTNHVKVIISLNSTDELYMRKWDIYWNNNRSNRKYTIDIVDTFENACNVDGCILRVFKFYKNADEIDESAKTTVFQLQYTKWLDSCGIVMEDIVSLCRIKKMLLYNPSELLEDLRKGNCKDTEKYSNEAWNKELLDSKVTDPLDPIRKSPLLVHCSAGCGRTGVFITLDFILNVLMEPTNLKNNIDIWDMDEDLIFITVNELRKQRISMVQNLTQYITCYESLLEYFAIQKRRRNRSIKQ